MRFLLSSIVGLLFGYPQSKDITNYFQADVLPIQIVLTIMAFGFAGGSFAGLKLISEKVGKSRWDMYFHNYTFALVCTMSISLPVLYRVGVSNVVNQTLFPVWFFFFFGIGLLVGGVYWWNNEKI